MKSEIHAVFDSKEGVIQAVEALLRLGVSEDDVILILPHTGTIPDSDNIASSDAQLEVVAAPKHVGSAFVLASEEGVGVGFGFGLLTAMCIPGIGMIAGSGSIIASLVAAGTVIGGVAGGIYGYLVERHIPHSAALAMADHITSGGAALSVAASDTVDECAVVNIIVGAGGRIIPSAGEAGAWDISSLSS